MLRIALLLVLAVVAFVIAFHLSSRRALPAVGSAAPDFVLPSQDGSTVALKDYRGQWIVLYFYPKDLTPGCTREAHNFSADQSQYVRRNTVVLGVSLDSVDSHKRFCAKEGLNFKLLADQSGRITHAYGSLTNFGLAKFAARHTFVIDPEGKIVKVYPNVNPAKHSAEVLAALDQLQSQKFAGLPSQSTAR